MCLPAPCCVVISKSGNIPSHEVHSANYYNSTLSMFIQISVSTIGTSQVNDVSWTE